MLKGAILSIDLFGLPQVIAFQYNPDRVSRSLQGQMAGEGGERTEAMRVLGAPVETIRFEEVDFDATDAMEKSDPVTAGVGIYPQLAQLELLLYPKSATVIANTALLAAGTTEIIAPEAPFTILSWGAQRILPVRLSELSITEEAFDSNLNPIRARLSLGFRVLSYNDLPITHLGYYVFLAHQILKEGHAAMASTRTVEAIAREQIRVVVPNL